MRFSLRYAVIHYVNSIFLSYRSKQFMLPMREQATHEASLTFLLGILCEGGSSSDKDASSASEDEDAQEMHWRDRLVAAWFILQFVDERDLSSGDSAVMSQLWTACSTLIEEEAGQPLQRVSLGLLGRLVSLALVDESQTSGSSDAVQAKHDLSKLRSMVSSEKFCRAFGNALVFDHREDTSVGGGHSAQVSMPSFHLFALSHALLLTANLSLLLFASCCGTAVVAGRRRDTS